MSRQGPKTSFRVPAAPIRHLIQSWLDVRGNDKTYLGSLFFPDLGRRQARNKVDSIMRIRFDKSTMDFDLADMILCRLGRPELWIEDAELYEAYRLVDLAALDVARPVTVAA